jgi:peptidoglycan hydrolase-like protein with peptidoglycan-binding domain
MTGASVRRFLRPALQIGLPLAAAALATTTLAQQPPGSIKMPPMLNPPSSAAAAPPEKMLDTSEWMALPIDDLRRRAHAGEPRAMEELARRLVSGIGVPQDSQSGAGWLLRAAEAGSPGAAFNVGVMYERGFVVERDSTRAVEWYQKAVDGNVAVAKHNLALLLREGRGAPRDAKRAIDLLQSATRQGMTASMFSLGDIYERGDVAPKDLPLALAWYTVTVEFERRRGHGAESPLARTAQQRIETMRRVLTPAELERAEKLAQMEQHAVVAALTPKPEHAPPLPPVSSAEPAPDSDEAIGWPSGAVERVRAIQQALIDLNRLRDKADGIAGSLTRAAIREFEKAAGMPESGEPTRDLYVALLRALQAQRDTVARSPLPPPPKIEPPKPQLAKVEPPPPPTPPKVDATTPAAKVEPPPARTEAPPDEPAKAPDPPKQPPRAKTEPAASPAPKAEGPPPPPPIELGKTEPPPPPPSSADIVRAMPKPEPKPDPDGWPAGRVEQIRAIQALMAELKLVNFPPSGELGPMTLAALRDYQRKAGLGESGEPSRAVYLRLKADRDEAARRPPPPVRIDIGRTEPPPPPPTSADIAKAAIATGPPAARPKTTMPDPDGWPAGRVEQIRAVQALMAELKLVNFPPTGELGPMTLAALRDYQRKAGLGESGEPSRALYLKLKADRDEAGRRPPPPAAIDIGKTEPPPAPPTSADIAKATASRPRPLEPATAESQKEPQPEVATAPKPEPPKPGTLAWPANRTEQVRAIQGLLRDLKLFDLKPNGHIGPLTTAAIRDYQRMAGMPQTGEPTKALFESLKEMVEMTALRPAAKRN